MTEAEQRAERHYYETLSLAELIGQPGDSAGDLLMECTNALANLKASLVEFYQSPPPPKTKLN